MNPLIEELLKGLVPINYVCVTCGKPSKPHSLWCDEHQADGLPADDPSRFEKRP